jgi:hypothetical protein
LESQGDSTIGKRGQQVWRAEVLDIGLEKLLEGDFSSNSLKIEIES